MTEIFDPKYRKYMGEFFLTTGLICMGVSVGTLLFLVPGIIIGLAWSLAVLLAIDKGKDPIDAMALSYNLTNGYKLRMMGVYLLISLIFLVAQIILMIIAILTEISGLTVFLVILVFLTMLFEVLVFIGLQASVYRQLAENV